MRRIPVLNQETQMVVSLNRGPPYRPHNSTVLTMGTPKKVPLILEPPDIQRSTKPSRTRPECSGEAN